MSRESLKNFTEKYDENEKKIISMYLLKYESKIIYEKSIFKQI